MPSHFETSSELPPASLPRRLAAMIYDGLLCLALVMVVTGVYTGLHQLLINYSLIGHDRYEHMLEADSSLQYDPILSALLLLSLWCFFGFFWRRSGQTLGMQAWKIRIQNEDGSPLSWLQALLRVLMGILSWSALGLGYLWQLIHQHRRSWTDLGSNSVTLFIGKPGTAS